MSPVSRLSTGVIVGGGSVNKSVSLLHVEDSQKYCSGQIGTGAARACVKPDCTIASHQLGKNKISLQDDTLYIMCGPASVFCEPCLSHSLITSEKELDHYLGEEHPVELWRAQFQGVKAAAGMSRRARTTPNCLTR